MKGLVSLRKLAVAIAVCLVVLCLPGYSEPTPEEVAEWEQFKNVESMIEKFLQNGTYVKVCERNLYILAARIYSIYVTTESVVLRYDAASGSGSLELKVNRIFLDKDCNIIERGRP